MKEGTCKLCLEYKKLCKESHIIPKSLYRLLAGENNQLIYINEEKSKPKYNSEYEGGILCENCDNKVIGLLDDYAAKFIYGEFPNKGTSGTEWIEGRETVIRENDPSYDYSRFKLFLLSVLWRASISSRPFFQKLKLPSAIEEDLRQRILTGSPGQPDEYPCFIHLPPLITQPDGRRGFETFYMQTMSPIYMDRGELKMCEFIIQGMHYYFIIARPANMNVLPSVDTNRLTMAFSKPEEHTQIIQTILDFMKGHPKRK
ncbi:MAG TPA: hypothetical protein VFQ72_02290 [Candidatus Paceibacterota bacterium]|nr:hypothetical protein [Candidatus Paceibacterota bacterium]